MQNKIFIFLFLSIIIIGCKKEAGEGGTSVIEGKVYKIFTFQTPQGQTDTIYFMPDEGKDIFIIYGNNEQTIYDDKFEADFNGKFRFDFLRKGEYTIYTLDDSTDDNNISYTFPLFQHIEITKNNSTILAKDFIIEKND